MNVEVDRVTLIHPNKTEEFVIDHQCRVCISGPDAAVEVPADAVDFPPWDRRGVDVVAAQDDGTVAVAFTAINVKHAMEFSDLPGKWRVYYGTHG